MPKPVEERQCAESGQRKSVVELFVITHHTKNSDRCQTAIVRRVVAGFPLESFESWTYVGDKSVMGDVYRFREARLRSQNNHIQSVRNPAACLSSLFLKTYRPTRMQDNSRPGSFFIRCQPRRKPRNLGIIHPTRTPKWEPRILDDLHRDILRSELLPGNLRGLRVPGRIDKMRRLCHRDKMSYGRWRIINR